MAFKLQINTTELPDQSRKEMDFLDSSYFRDNGDGQRLPTPAEVCALAGSDHNEQRPRPVRFDHLGLIVKFGPCISIAEAQSLWVIKRVLGDEVPVPEVYGWREEGCRVFIYMQLIEGETLKDQWKSYATADKIAVCEHLNQIIKSLRQVEQDPNDVFIGSINRHHLQDIIFEEKQPGGPFNTVAKFHDWFSSLPWLPYPDFDRTQDPWRESLPDHAPIKLTHGDLHRGNIIVSSKKPPRVLAIVDWAHCGWYPDYWEYCKAAYTSSYQGGWRNKWIPMFLDCHDEVYEVFSEYTLAMGAL